MSWIKKRVIINGLLLVTSALILGFPLLGGEGQWGKMSGSEARAADLNWDQEAKFYKGKVVKIIISTKPGGGHDTYGRLYAANLPRYLSGARTVVKNIVGAGQIIGHNKLYESKPDGLSMGSINRGMLFNQLIGTRGIRFDLRKFVWLGNMAAAPRFFVVGNTSKFRSLEDIGKGNEKIKIGTTGRGTVAYSDTKMLAEIFDWPVKQVSGYRGSTSALLASIKGEVDGMVGIYDTIRGALEGGDVKAILQMGGKRVPGLEGVPLLHEVADPKWKDLLRLLKIQYSVSRLVATTPGIPEARTRFLREVFRRMAKDKEFLAMAKKWRRPIDFIPGEEIQKWINDALNQPPEVVELLERLIGGKS